MWNPFVICLRTKDAGEGLEITSRSDQKEDLQLIVKEAWKGLVSITAFDLSGVFLPEGFDSTLPAHI